MDLFTNLKSFFKTRGSTIDNGIFQLHYKGTCMILLAFSILVSARQYFGDPIECLLTGTEIPSKLVDTFCWVHTTFSLPDAWEKEVGKDVPYPGIDTYVKGEKRVYHAYYQWVCFVLFIQAILFYTPRYFWKMAEGSRMKQLVMNLNLPCLEEEIKNKNRNILVRYLVSNLDSHRMYALSYFIAEILNFANVVGQIFLIDRFLGGEFSQYGLRVIQFTEWAGELRNDPMIHVFPRLTKCNFFIFGASGSLEKRDALCLLPINVLNEKIYIFLWFWFIILSILSAATLVYRLVLLFWPPCRFFAISFRSRCVNKDHLQTVIEYCDLSDWFVFYLLSKNLDAVNFRDVITDMAKKLDVRTQKEFRLP